jgi:hypothetical protein
VHKLRNLARKAPKDALAEIRDDFHRIVYATSADAARIAYAAFERAWGKRYPGRRRVKTQGSLPSEEAAVVLLFSLVVSGQIKLRKIDGWRKIAGVLSQHTAAV